jgi:phosphoglycolate phosphatase
VRGRPAAILFDLDGTLLDSAQAICAAVSAALGDFDVAVTPEEIEPHLGAPLDELFALYVGEDVGTHRAHFTERYIAHHDAHPQARAMPFPTVEKALVSLRRDHAMKTAIATTKPSHRAHAQLAHHGLDAWLDHVQGTDPGMRPKPYPDVIEHACRALGVSPGDVWMVGDTARDVGAARRAGAKVAVVAWDDAQHARAVGFEADLILRSMEDLLARLG